MARRPLFDQIGRFDEGQWMYAEDLDLAGACGPPARPPATSPPPGSATRPAPPPGRRSASASVRRHTAASYAWLRRRRGRAVATLYALSNVVGAAGVAAGALVRRDRGQLTDALRWLSLHARALKGRGELEP